MIRTLSSYNENPYQVLLPKTVLQSGSDGNRNPTPIKRCEPWYKKRTPQSRMENSIDKSRMNATEKSDKFKLVLKEQKTIYSQFLNTIPLQRVQFILQMPQRSALEIFLN